MTRILQIMPMITHLLSIKSVLGKLEEDSSVLVNWIRYNGLKANPNQFHLLLSDHDEDHLIRVANFTIQNSKSGKLVGIRLDNGMTFDSHVSEICNKARQKLHALSRVCRIMGLTQRNILMQAFITCKSVITHYSGCFIVEN